jgi:hypothetical protein
VGVAPSALDAAQKSVGGFEIVLQRRRRFLQRQPAQRLLHAANERIFRLGRRFALRIFD